MASSERDELEALRKRSDERRRHRSAKRLDVEQHEAAVYAREHGAVERIKSEQDAVNESVKEREEAMAVRKVEIARSLLQQEHEIAEKRVNAERSAAKEEAKRRAKALEEASARLKRQEELRARKAALLAKRLGEMKDFKDAEILRVQAREKQAENDRSAAILQARQEHDIRREALENAEREKAEVEKRLDELQRDEAARLNEFEETLGNQWVPQKGGPSKGVADRIAAMNMR